MFTETGSSSIGCLLVELLVVCLQEDEEMPKTLRFRVIRLAHEKPELRPDLLPLLKESRIAAEPLITVPYLEKLVETVVNDPSGWGEASPAARILNKEIRSLKNEFSGVEPYPVSELLVLLEDGGVDEDEIALVKAVRPPTSRQRKKKPQEPLVDAYLAFGKAIGKSVSLVDIDLDTDGHLVPMIKAWQTAIVGVKSKEAKAAWDKYVKKVVLRAGSQGSEDASWRHDKMILILRPEKLSIPVRRSFVVHELGHGVEQNTVKTFAGTPYGSPPFVSEYAKGNPSEDFAETFRVMAENPRGLQKQAPEKYADMAARLQGKEPPPLRPSLTEAQEKSLTDWAVQAFSLFRDPSRSTRELSEDVLYAVIGKAKRDGITADQMIGWLQRAYSGVWVRQTDLKPGVDLKDLVKIIKNKLR